MAWPTHGYHQQQQHYPPTGPPYQQAPRPPAESAQPQHNSPPQQPYQTQTPNNQHLQLAPGPYGHTTQYTSQQHMAAPQWNPQVPPAAPPLPPRPRPWEGPSDGGTGTGAASGAAALNTPPPTQWQQSAAGGHAAWSGGNLHATGAGHDREAGLGRPPMSGQDQYAQPYASQAGHQWQHQHQQPVQQPPYQPGYQQPTSQASPVPPPNPSSHHGHTSPRLDSSATAYGAGALGTYSQTNTANAYAVPAQPAPHSASGSQEQKTQQYTQYGVYPTSHQPATSGPPPIPHATRPTSSLRTASTTLAQPAVESQTRSHPVGLTSPPHSQQQHPRPHHQSQTPQYQQNQQPQPQWQQQAYQSASGNSIHPAPRPTTIAEVFGRSPTSPPQQNAQQPPDLGGLANQLGAMNISQTPQGLTSSWSSPPSLAPPVYTPSIGTASNDDDDELAAADIDRIMRLPPLRDDGPPSARMSCYPQEVLTPETYYHANGHSDDITMCAVCYAELVAGSPMEKDFTAQRRSVGSCVFRAPPVRRLLRVARRSGTDAQAAIEAVVRLHTIEACPAGAVEADAGIKWYVPRSSQGKNDILACEQCYAHYVEGTRWAGEWTVVPHTPGQLWACDLTGWFARRSFFKLLATASRDPSAFDKWVAGIKQWLALPECSGEPIHDTVKWWRPTQQYNIENFVVCDTCYHDFFVYSRFAAGFEPAHVPAATCDMADPWVREATVRVVQYGDMEVWHPVVSAIYPWVERPPSNVDNDEVASGRKQLQMYYTLRGPQVNFDVCARCLHATFDPFGVVGRFVEQHLPAEGRMCDMCNFGSPQSALDPERQMGIGHFRAVAIEDRLLEAVHTGVWAHFTAFMAVLCSLPACRERMSKVNGTWYGFPELPVSEACWWSFAAGTRLAARAVLQGEEIPGETVCALYSRNMRVRVLQWCDTDSTSTRAEADAELVALLDFGVERAETWHRTCKPWILRKMTEQFKTQMAMIHATMSIHHNMMDSMNRLTFGKSDRLHDILTSNKHLNQSVGHGIQAMGWANAAEGDDSPLLEWEEVE